MKPEPTSSFRTLIECMNVMLTSCPFTIEIIVNYTDYKVSITLSRKGNIIHTINNCHNLQSAYEELFMWILERAKI